MAEDPQAQIAQLTAEVEALRRRVAELQLLADRDPSTPLLNRRAFLRELQRALAFRARYGGGGVLAYFDLDGLKALNDGFGHAAGDAAIALVAQALADNIRETDFAARLGGDEFGVVLVQTDPAEGRRKARALAELIAAEPLVFGGRKIAVRASVGVQALTEEMDAAAHIAAADAAMYLNKRAR